MSDQLSTNSQNPESLYRKAMFSEAKNDDRQALSYYKEARNQIRSMDGNGTIENIDQLR